MKVHTPPNPPKSGEFMVVFQDIRSCYFVAQMRMKTQWSILSVLSFTFFSSYAYCCYPVVVYQDREDENQEFDISMACRYINRAHNCGHYILNYLYGVIYHARNFQDYNK
jgi:hypothetical protein